jgi:predicted phosphodiesterase
LKKEKKKADKRKEKGTSQEVIRSYPGVVLDLKENKLPVIELPMKKGENFGEVVFMGDFHIGSTQFSEHQLIAYIHWIAKHPHVRAVLMGDLVELGDLSGYLPEQDENFKQQVRKLITFLSPIRHQIVCILEGNHEGRYAKASKGGINFSDYVATELEIKKQTLRPGPKKGQLMVFKCGNFYYPIYAIHGYTSALFQKATQLKRMAFNKKIPLIVHGHTHQIFEDHYVYKIVNRIGNDFYESFYEQHWLTSGCFVKYLGYAEERSYPLTKIGAPIVRFFGEEEGIVIITNPFFFYGIGRNYKDTFSQPPSILDVKQCLELKRELGIEKLRELRFFDLLLKKKEEKWKFYL